MKIEDGKGKNGDASVSVVQRLNVSAKTAPRMFYAARDFGLTFNAISVGAFSYDNGGYCFYIKNTSPTKNMYIKHIEYHSEDAARWVLHEVTGTAAGATTIVPSNLNLGSGLLAEATCMGGAAAITGLTPVKTIGTHRTTALSEGEMLYDGALVVTPNKAIAVEYDKEEGGTAGIVEIDLFFWYEDIGAS